MYFEPSSKMYDIGDLDDKIQVAFEFFKVQFEYDREKSEKIRESRSASGKKGGRPKSKPKQIKQMLFLKSKPKQKKLLM